MAAKEPKKERVSGRIKRAVEEMVLNGKPRSEAAEIAGLRDDSLYRALLRPHVLGYRNHLLKVIRTSASSRTIARAEALADTAQSEHVRLQANEWIAGLDAETTPVQRNETTHRYPDGRPGLVIVMQSGSALAPIDGTQVAELPSHLRHLPAPVPHPSQVKRQENADAE